MGSIPHAPPYSCARPRRAEPRLGAKSLDDAGIGTLRRTDTALLVDPARTGEVSIVLVDELLSNDPRAGRAPDTGQLGGYDHVEIADTD